VAVSVAEVALSVAEVSVAQVVADVDGR